MLTKVPRQQSLVLHRNFENSIFFFPDYFFINYSTRHFSHRDRFSVLPLAHQHTLWCILSMLCSVISMLCLELMQPIVLLSVCFQPSPPSLFLSCCLSDIMSCALFLLTQMLVTHLFSLSILFDTHIKTYLFCL